MNKAEAHRVRKLHSEYQKIWAKTHPEQVQAASRKWAKALKGRAWYKAHRAQKLVVGRKRYKAHRMEISVKNRAQQQEIKVIAKAEKLSRGCIDCGYKENADALEFDHVRGIKSNAPTSIISMVSFILEVDKCEVRCANCHAIRTMSARRKAKALSLGNGRSN